MERILLYLALQNSEERNRTNIIAELLARASGAP